MNNIYAVVDNNVISNIIVADSSFVSMINSLHQAIQLCPPDAGIGNIYSDGLFASPLTNQSVPNGSTITFYTQVYGGSGNYTYQWNFNSGNISGAESSSYQITNVTSANAGTYSCSCSDGISSISTNSVTLTIL